MIEWSFNFGYQFADMMAFLLLSALGLIIILGVLKIINLAHGEMIMIGAYVTSALHSSGIPLLLCFVASFISLFLVGMIFERLRPGRNVGSEPYREPRHADRPWAVDDTGSTSGLVHQHR
jgi:Branched-chain amino acid transport system / permease component